MKPPTPPIQAVVLDLGGVVLALDWLTPVQSLGIQDRLAGRGLSQFLVDWEHHDHYERGKSQARQFFAELARVLEIALPTDKIIGAWNQIVSGPIPGVEKLMAEVSRRTALYALSNTNATHFEFFHRAFPSSMAHFRKVYTSFELGLRKPDPLIYTRLAENLNLPPSQILFVDDNPDNVGGARDAGLRAEQCLNSADRLREIFLHYGVLEPNLDASPDLKS